MAIENITFENCHIMQKQDIDAFAYCHASVFEGYLLFEYFSGKKAEKIKEKYVTNDCWYLYGFVVLPEFRRRGLAAQVLPPMLSYFDKTQKDCYLDTLEEENFALYEHYVFSLVESVCVPKTNLTLYAMLRKSSNVWRSVYLSLDLCGEIKGKYVGGEKIDMRGRVM